MEEKESLRIFHEGKTETKKDASNSVGSCCCADRSCP